MTLFWIICAALLIVAILFVALPLWRGTSKNNSVARDAANLEILRDQIAEMDVDLKNGLLTSELYEQGKRELQGRVLEEVGSERSAAPADAPRSPFKVLVIVLSVLLPLLSVGLYMKIGNPNAFSDQIAYGGTSNMGAPLTGASISALEKKVEANPADGESLVMLARGYLDTERYAESVQAFEKLTKLVADEAWVWADYADALAMAQGQTLRGKPTELINKALALDPNHAKGLALAGSAAMERGDFAAAIQHWEKLRIQLQPESEDAKMIDSGLAEARKLLSHIKDGKPSMLGQINQSAQTAPTSSGKERITGTVTISDALKGKLSPDDTVFVLARAAEGPKIPLAILRKQVRDLPLTFELDDSMAMAPQMKLSAFDKVVVIARTSKAGAAKPQPGDAQGMSQPLRPGTKNVNVKIDQLVE
ncbi:MAG: c-type cytochrome biogenesis protein CcmI [Sideroxyarcus sp.]|nr:c-type cytochrome biogenesis protein CcmI [Sideroxyarcus sp.]